MAGREGLISEIWDKGRLAWRLLNDARVPTWVKVGIPIIVAIYLFSPIDIIPDFIPGFGQLDDLGVVVLAMGLIIRLSPRPAVEEHSRALGIDLTISTGSGTPSTGEPTRRMSSDEETIDGEYKVIRKNQSG
jgi:uncharacterized membrane protein YkvA (DUF1232 family)